MVPPVAKTATRGSLEMGLESRDRAMAPTLAGNGAAV
jgi:hypothetical protein